jgi:hypothetical protein
MKIQIKEWDDLAMLDNGMAILGSNICLSFGENDEVVVYKRTQEVRPNGTEYMQYDCMVRMHSDYNSDEMICSVLALYGFDVEIIKPRTLTKREHACVMYLPDDWFLCRQPWGSLVAYNKEPFRRDAKSTLTNINECWTVKQGDVKYYEPFSELFEFITWEEGLVYPIKELRKLEVAE